MRTSRPRPIWTRGSTTSRAGAPVAASELHPRDTAQTVRVPGGELLVTDGSFTESTEWIAGFAILECSTLDEAVEIASRNPIPYQGRLEVRPVLHSDGI